MKTILLISAMLVATATPLRAVDRSYDFKNFSRVEIRGGVEVDLHVGSDFDVELDVSRQALLRRIELRQVGDTLIIERTRGSSFFMMGLTDRYDVTVNLPELTAVKAVAGADVSVEGPVTGSLEVRASSGADLELDRVAASDVFVTSSSGADIELSGSCTTLRAKVSSGADIHAEDLRCHNVELRASSGGDLRAFASEAAQARASSGSDIRVYGPAVIQDFNESSGGDIRPAS